MLDLGCGTGRYFHCAQNVKSLVGVDPSEHMLQQAREPVMGGNRNVRLIRSTLHEVAFQPQSFDLVICVGVLGLWCPLDEYVLGVSLGMLRPDGVFFLTAIEYEPVAADLQAKDRRCRPTAAVRRAAAIRRRQAAGVHRFRGAGASARRGVFRAGDDHEMAVADERVDLHCVMSQPKPGLTGASPALDERNDVRI